MYERITKEKLLAILGEENWEKKLSYETAVDVIWAANDIAKSTDLTTDKRAHEAMKIVRHYRDDLDPMVGDPLDKEIREDKETRTIATIRGTLCWLLQNIIVTLETSYYSEIIDVLEQFAKDPSLYLRQQVAIPLEILVANMKATKNRDGTPFDFGAENQRRTEALAFSMLEENHSHPRILEYLARSFDKMRYLDEDRAQHVIEAFYFSPSKQPNPNYVVENIIPALIYFAEFKKNQPFNNSWFQSFLKKIIHEADSDLGGHIVWIFWKICEEDRRFFEKLKGYIYIFLDKPPEHHLLSQMGFLVEKIIDEYPDDAIDILIRIIRLFRVKINDPEFTSRLWIFYDDNFIAKLKKESREKLLPLLAELQYLKNSGVSLAGLEKLVDEGPQHAN